MGILFLLIADYVFATDIGLLKVIVKEYPCARAPLPIDDANPGISDIVKRLDVVWVACRDD